MATDPKNHRKPSSAADLQQFHELARANTPTRVIGLKTSRTPTAVKQKASSENTSLKPTNQRHYRTKTK